MKKRVDYLDIVGGFFIIIMILSHVEARCWQSTFKLKVLLDVFNFFMPWFFYKSGYFYRKRTAHELLDNGVKKLLVPFFVFFILSIPLFYIELGIRLDTNWMHYAFSPFKALLLQQALDTNSPLWFLVTLFGVQLAYNFLEYHLGKHKQVKMFVILVLVILLAYILCKEEIDKPYILANFCSGLFFYGLGRSLNRHEIQMTKIQVTICVFAYAMIYMLCPSILSMYMNKLEGGNYFVWIISSVVGILAINGLVRYFCDNRFLSYIGKHSMGYYVLHYPIIVAISFIIHDGLKLSDTIMYICMLFALVIFLPFAENILQKSNFKWILGYGKK